ncbi:MAG: hypothetical protein ABSB42_14910 [Tepidisphaeraceae bacterium]
MLESITFFPDRSFRMPDAIVIHRFGFQQGQFLPESIRGEYGPAIDAANNELTEEVERFGNDRLFVSKDRNLSDEGKADSLGTIKEASLAKLEAISESFSKAKLSEDWRKANAAIPTAPPPRPKDTMEFLEQQEIRQHLRNRPGPEFKAILKTAAEKGATAMVAAALYDPLGQLVPFESDREALADSWRRATFPQQFKRLADLQAVAQQLAYNRDAAMKLVKFASLAGGVKV